MLMCIGACFGVQSILSVCMKGILPVAISNSNPDPNSTSSISPVHTCTVNDSSAGLLVTRINVSLPADSSSLKIVVLKRTVTAEKCHIIVIQVPMQHKYVTHCLLLCL